MEYNVNNNELSMEEINSKSSDERMVTIFLNDYTFKRLKKISTLTSLSLENICKNILKNSALETMEDVNSIIKSKNEEIRDIKSKMRKINNVIKSSVRKKIK